MLKILLIFLGLISSQTQANELDDLLKDKLTEHVGTCAFNKVGQFVFTQTPETIFLGCIVGYQKGVKDARWVAVLEKNQVVKVVKINLSTKTQVVVWSKQST